MHHDDYLYARRGSTSRGSAARIGRWFGFVAVLAILIGGLELAAQANSDLVGASRGDVMRAFGEPESTLRKGDVDVLIYPDGVRIEIEDDVVIGYRGSVGSGVISRGGTEYAAGEDGNVHKAKPVAIELPVPVATTETEVVAPELPAEPAIEKPEMPDESTVEIPVAEKDAGDEAELLVHEEVDPDHLYDEASAQAEHYLEGFGVVRDPEPPSPAATAIGAILQVVARFGFALLILRITLGWLGRPFYFPDLIKVSLFYTAIRAVMHGIGGLGGNWEFVNIFKVPDIVAFFALAVLLFKFEVTKDGLTALKIAGATIAVTYFLMIGIGIVLVFGLGAVL